MLLLNSALAVAVVSVLGMDIDVSGFMQGLGTKPGLLLRDPVWQQVVFIPRQLLIPLLIPFREGFMGLLGLYSRFWCQSGSSSLGLTHKVHPSGLCLSNWEIATKVEACGSRARAGHPAGIPCNQCTSCSALLFPTFGARVPSCSLLLLSPGLSQGLRAVTRLCGEVTKCIFHKAHSSWWISRAAGGVLHMATAGAPPCQVLCRECRGFLALKIPLGILQAELGLAGGSWLGDRAQGGMVVLGRQSGVSAAVGVVCWIHPCWISVALSRNSAWFLNLLIEFLYREAGI